jgi:hypothetical protein
MTSLESKESKPKSLSTLSIAKSLVFFMIDFKILVYSCFIDFIYKSLRLMVFKHFLS